MKHCHLLKTVCTAVSLSTMLLCLLPLSSCKDSENTVDIPDKPTEEPDTVKLKVVAETSHVDVVAEGGEAYVFIKAYSSLSDAPQLTADMPWVKVERKDIIGGSRENHKGFYELVYVLNVDENKGLGRASTLTFTYTDIKGNEGEPVKVTLHQWPRNFHFSETINVSQPGQLPILMGGNTAAWSNLKELKLSGQLNTADMRTLRLLLRRSVRSYVTYRDANGGTAEISTASTMNLRKLDMGDCELVEDGDTAVEECIEDFDDNYVQTHNALGKGAFFVTGCKLDSIVLPRNLTEIGADAFRMCENLSYIDLPASVTSIGSYAFFNCLNMKDIRIPDNSVLKSIGALALNPGSRLNSISFPSSLEVVEKDGILGNVAAENIHVKWTTPPTLSRFRILDITTLWVPQGTAAAYKAAFGWNHAKEIKEE